MVKREELLTKQDLKGGRRRAQLYIRVEFLSGLFQIATAF